MVRGGRPHVQVLTAPTLAPPATPQTGVSVFPASTPGESVGQVRGGRSARCREEAGRAPGGGGERVPGGGGEGAGRNWLHAGRKAEPVAGEVGTGSRVTGAGRVEAVDTRVSDAPFPHTTHTERAPAASEYSRIY